MGSWKILVELCLPIPLVLTILLCLPAPRVFHRSLLKVVDHTLGLNFISVFSLLHLMLAITGVSFLGSIHATYNLSGSKPDPDASPNVIAGHLGKRWRAERNFWLSFICFTMWCLLARLFVIMKNKAVLEDELDKARKAAPGSSSSIPTRPAGPTPKSVDMAKVPDTPKTK